MIAIPIAVSIIFCLCIIIGFYFDREIRWLDKIYITPLMAILLHFVVLGVFTTYNFWVMYGDEIISGYFLK